MIRVLKDPIIISAMVISFIMAFFINIPIISILMVISFVNVLRVLYKSTNINRILVILFLIFAGELSLLNYSYINQRNYLPIVTNTIKSGSVIVLKDSNPSEYGYFTTGILYQINNKQIISQSCVELMLYSNYPLFRGQLLNNCILHTRDNEISTNIKKIQDLNFKNIFYKIRYKIINSIYDRVGSSLFIALSLGSKIWLEPHLINNFRTSGCSHILALSGFHVAIISLMFFILFRIFFTGNKIYIFILLFLTIYILLAGITPSLLRSVIMFAIATIFKLRKQKINLLRIVALSLILITFFIPEDFYTLSFQLSFLALAGIIILSPIINELPCYRVLPMFIKSPLSASISAILFTAFISFNSFGTIYPVGIVASLIISPLITIFIWFSILGIFFTPLLIISSKIERIIYYLVEFFSGKGEIQSSSSNSLIITFIIISIPVILFFINYYRRLDAGRFNIKFKL